jgi:hypothetical protein
VRRRKIKYKIRNGRGRRRVRGRRKNFLVALASINHFATWNGGERRLVDGRHWKRKRKEVPRS